MALLQAPFKNLTNTMILDKIKAFFNDTKVYKVESVQQLWSGYGEIARYYVPVTKQTCIGKVIRLDKVKSHPRGWNTEFAHQRKLSSYYNEQAFYKNYSTLCDDNCRIPRCIETGNSQDYLWMILEDLDAADYSLRYAIGNKNIAKAGLRWLATFHAKFLAMKKSSSEAQTWPTGTYWHLATRPDEWHNMPDSELKHSAKIIDQKLEQASYKTQLHGDAKLANFCFAKTQSHQQLPALAALDFQYTGAGVGVKDLIYYLGSCFDSKQLDLHAEGLVDFYFAQLRKATFLHHPNINSQKVEEEWRDLLCFAWADFERFLAGWSPKHHKRNDYSAKQTAQALSAINS